MNCPSCAGELPDSARFCLHCGTPCAPTAPIASAQRADERKVVTVVFCDLVGSTALSGRLDPEALRSVTLHYFELMTSRIEAHGGTVEKFIGDAVMAVFGIPVMHEDDARRAVAATLDMLTALAELNSELTAALGIRLDVRIGVNTGEAVANSDASARQALVSGEVVNVAARLEQNAGAGQILIGPETLRAVGAAAVVEDAGLLTLKGKSEQVRAHRLLGLQGDDPELLRRFDTPLIGREAELAALESALARPENGSGLVTLYGEAGIGKTRLIREWLLRSTPRWGAGRCRPYGESGSLAPLADALRRLLDSALPTVVPAALVPEVLRQGLLHDGTPNPSVEDTCAALTGLLSELAVHQPVVLVLDDFHWAGPVLRDVLERLTAGLVAQHVLIVCAARLELLEHSPDWGAGAHSILLPGLSAAESVRLAAGLAEVSAHGAGTMSQLLERAEGNPLHLEQLLAMVAENRNPDELPPTVQALLGARIDALEAAERTTLSLASVVGREFGQGELTGLARSGPEGRPGGELQPDAAGLDTLPPALLRLVRRRLVEPDGRDAGYRFSSGLVQEVSYQGMAKRVRAERHERAADLLAGRGAPDSSVGNHLAKAHRYRSELGLIDPHTQDLRRRAAGHLAAAGALALARADLGWAEELLDGAVALARPGEPAWLTAAWRLAEVRLATGRTEEGRQLLQDVATTDDPVVAAHARLGLAVLDPGPGLGHAARTAREVLPLFETAQDHLGVARACLRLAQHQQLLGRHGTAETLLERALEQAVLAGAEPERAAALGAIGVSLWMGPTPVPAAVARCRALLAEHGSDRRAAQVTLNCPLAVLLALRQDWDGARRCLAEADRLCRELGFAEALVFMPIFRAAVEALADRPARATRLLREADRACRELGATSLLGGITRDLARVLLDSGDLAGAHAHLDELSGLLSPAGPADCADQLPLADSADLHGTLARLRAGSEQGAADLAARAVAEAERTDSPVVQATAALDEAHTALALGHETAAAGAAARAGRHFAAKGHLVGVRRAADLTEAAHRAQRAQR
ncbi:adenylate/guanylate cyclase domain-containing protein [Kitasatospora sp. MAP5-34]|uniref:AAA family ATPase n=1 Tax=Kitasatospora sp. MAP5-34 TaxID=3035102 RepID=UPI0024762975|nr:adenylate/guanylate cyclase domain-containing protein [Kitasatospora sp. MAP5-34]MDH6578734.1 class 3 adenylate cyclase [Kitasatospora sp. MAP5-34]